MSTISATAENTIPEHIQASLERRGRKTCFPRSGGAVKKGRIDFGFDMSEKWAKCCDAGDY